jgi:hypothetical protein
MAAIQLYLPTISLLVTALLAFTGWLVTYWNARELARRKERLDLSNKRLNEFYGPLYVATSAGAIAYRALLNKLGHTDDIFGKGKQPTEQEMIEWFAWMKHVFMPLNEICEKVIIHNAYLVREQEMPECLLAFVTHVVGYRAVLAKWEKGDLSEPYSLTAFPARLDQYAAHSYAQLKTDQAELIGLTQK